MKSKNPTSTPAYWEDRYLKNDIPWDAGKVPKDLEKYLENPHDTCRVLVPGCGSAYEARAFAEAGFDVLAIDFSPAAVLTAKQTLNKASKNALTTPSNTKTPYQYRLGGFVFPNLSAL
jgi:SAM-dependent methyltransferase